MAYLRFLKSENIYKAIVIPESDTLVTIKFDSEKEVSTSGFDLFDDEKCTVDIGGEYYHKFTTVYRNDEETEKYNGYQLSSDGSKYVPPEIVQTYEPTLEEIKDAKRQEMSNACQQTIYNGIDVQLASGETKHFSLKQEDQINLFGKQVQLATSIDRFEYHADGEPCTYFSREDMQNIVTKAMEFVSYHTTYCNSLYDYIESMESKENVETVVYGIEIPEQYQSEVLKDYISRMKW